MTRREWELVKALAKPSMAANHFVYSPNAGALNSEICAADTFVEEGLKGAREACERRLQLKQLESWFGS